MPSSTTGPIVLPRLYLYKGLDHDPILTRKAGTFDWNDWTDIFVNIPGLSISLSLLGGELQILDANRLKIKFRVAQYASGDAGSYRWQVTVNNGSETLPVPVGEGEVRLLAAVT